MRARSAFVSNTPSKYQIYTGLTLTHSRRSPADKATFSASARAPHLPHRFLTRGAGCRHGPCLHPASWSVCHHGRRRVYAQRGYISPLWYHTPARVSFADVQERYGSKYLRATAVLPKIPHSNWYKTVSNRPLRGRRGRFGTLLQLLECGFFRRTTLFACPLARFVTSLTLCGRAFLGSACHPMCGPRLRCDFLAAGATLTVAKRRSHDSAPTARS